MEPLDVSKPYSLDIENRHFWDILRDLIAQLVVGARHMNRMKERTQPTGQGLGYRRILLQNNDTQTHISPDQPPSRANATAN